MLQGQIALGERSLFSDMLQDLELDLHLHVREFGWVDFHRSCLPLAVAGVLRLLCGIGADAPLDDAVLDGFLAPHTRGE
jgi:hypothetical protein